MDVLHVFKLYKWFQIVQRMNIMHPINAAINILVYLSLFLMLE